MSRVLVFSTLFLILFATQASATPGWGAQCQRYFDAVDRFCEVAAQDPSYAPACQPLQEAIAEMKAISVEADPKIMESACEQGAETMEQLISSIAVAQAVARSQQDPIFGEQCETYFSLIEEFCEMPTTELAESCRQQVEGIRSIRETRAVVPADVAQTMEARCQEAIQLFRASLKK